MMTENTKPFQDNLFYERIKNDCDFFRILSILHTHFGCIISMVLHICDGEHKLIVCL